MIRIKVLFTLFVVYCGSAAIAQQSELHSTVSAERLERLVNGLSADSMKGRLSGTPNMVAAAQIIAAEFREAGLSFWPGDSSFFQEFQFAGQDGIRTGINVIGVLPGKSRIHEGVIFSSHYDHIGTKSSAPLFGPSESTASARDTIYNGANDNASGTAAVISLAHYFSKAALNERTIIFACFSAEEFGLLGSKEFAAYVNVDSIVAVINLEMLGRGALRPFVTGDQHSNLRTLLNKHLKLVPDSIDKQIEFRRDPYSDHNLFARSDNYHFALAGIPAHTIMLTSPTDRFYHKVSDQSQTLNYHNMALITRAVARAALGLIQGTDTPVRIRMVTER